MTILLGLCGCAGTPSAEYTRGIGEYPGKTDDYAGPEIVAGGGYRNLALNRAAYHSSSYDYNLTGHLATDGIILDRMPYHIDVLTHKGPVEKRDKERIFDDNATNISVEGGSGACLLLQINGEGADADMLSLNGTAMCDLDAARGWSVKVLASADGLSWDELEAFRGANLPGEARIVMGSGGGSQNVAVSSGLKNVQMTEEMKEYIRMMESRRNFNFEVKIPQDKLYRHFRFDFDAPAVQSWTVSEILPYASATSFICVMFIF